ncbi:MAG: hypothetical protein ACJAZO_002097 [Myxococcota bacterium]|jgi:hypothetical protein
MLRSRRGASAVEFALTLPIVVVLAAITVEWGWVLSQQAWIHAAARDSTRFAVELDPNDFDVEQQAIQSAGEWLAGYQFDCADTLCAIDAQVGHILGRDALTVLIDVDYQPIFGLIPVPESLHGESTYLLKYQEINF